MHEQAPEQDLWNADLITFCPPYLPTATKTSPAFALMIDFHIDAAGPTSYPSFCDEIGSL